MVEREIDMIWIFPIIATQNSYVSHGQFKLDGVCMKRYEKLTETSEGSDNRFQEGLANKCKTLDISSQVFLD